MLPCLLTAATTLLVVALKPAEETPPPGTVEQIAAALPAKPYAPPQHPRKLLVFSKTNGFRHASIATGKVALTELGKRTGAFTTHISDDLAEFETNRLAGYDAVCFLSTTQNVFLPHPVEFATLDENAKQEARSRETRLKQNLMQFIRSGKGFVGIHAATDTCYEWQEFGTMINGYFDGHPWTADTQVSIRVEPGQERHPLADMFEGQRMEFKEEIYQLKSPYQSKAVHMLLRLDTEHSPMNLKGIKRSDGDFGVAWARHWDQGRVFYCSLGHNHHIYTNPKILRHYLAGIQWAIGDLKVEVRSENPFRP